MGQKIRVVHHSLKSVLDHSECIEKYCGKLKFFKILPDGIQPWLFWSCQDKKWARKSGLYTIHRLSFAKNMF